jgi:hypothetical protein
MGLEPLLIEPIDDGGFESYAAVAVGMIRLDLDMCGVRVSASLEDLDQCFAVRTGAKISAPSAAGVVPVREAGRLGLLDWHRALSLYRGLLV